MNFATVFSLTIVALVAAKIVVLLRNIGKYNTEREALEVEFNHRSTRVEPGQQRKTTLVEQSHLTSSKALPEVGEAFRKSHMTGTQDGDPISTTMHARRVPFHLRSNYHNRARSRTIFVVHGSSEFEANRGVLNKVLRSASFHSLNDRDKLLGREQFSRLDVRRSFLTSSSAIYAMIATIPLATSLIVAALKQGQAIKTVMEPIDHSIGDDATTDVHDAEPGTRSS